MNGGFICVLLLLLKDNMFDDDLTNRARVRVRF